MDNHAALLVERAGLPDVVQEHSLPSVSVIIPTYNRADTIESSVRSVLQQTYCDFELIVVDDASTDKTQEVLERIDDPRLTVFRTANNGGAARARNLGLEYAKAPLVAFQDSDDFWLPTKLASQIAVLNAAGAQCVGTFCSFIYLAGRRTAILPRAEEIAPGDIADTLLRRNLISTQTLLARRADLEAIGGFDAAMPRFQDWEISIRLTRRGEVRHDPTPLVVVRAMPNSISTLYEAGLEARQRILDLSQRIDAPVQARAAQHFDLGARLLVAGRTKDAAVAFREARKLGGGVKPLLGTTLTWLPGRVIKGIADSILARRSGVLR